MKAGRLVTIAVFEQPIEAELARGKLESENILAHVADANTVGVQPLYSLALGGVRLQVDEADVLQAKAVLNGESQGEGKDHQARPAVGGGERDLSGAPQAQGED